MEKKEIEMCVLDNHINTIYIMIIGYVWNSLVKLNFLSIFFWIVNKWKTRFN